MGSNLVWTNLVSSKERKFFKFNSKSQDLKFLEGLYRSNRSV